MPISSKDCVNHEILREIITQDYVIIQNNIEEFLKDSVLENKADGVIFGLSGGIDSAIVAYLSAKVFGKKALLNANKECRSWGIRVVDGIAKKGRSLILNEKYVGKVTSSTWSPYQVCGVGIVLLDNSNIGPGTVVDVECIDNKIHKAELCKLPMYDPKGEIVRGINRDVPQKPNPWAGIRN